MPDSQPAIVSGAVIAHIGIAVESIEAALEFQNVKFLPNTKFSTATEFFTTLEQKHDLSRIPTINTEMNTASSAGFFGVYTTHGDIKRWNRDAEATTEAAPIRWAKARCRASRVTTWTSCPT